MVGREPASRRPHSAAARRSRARVPLAALGLALVVALGGCTIPGFGRRRPVRRRKRDSEADAGAEWFRYEQGEQVESASDRPAWPATSAPGTSTPAAVAAPATSTPTCPTRLDPVTKPLRRHRRGRSGHPDLGPRRRLRGSSSTGWPPCCRSSTAGEDVSTRTWITVARPTTGCEEMTATVTGLIAGRHYVFWLDAVLTLPDGTTREPMIGRSNAVLVE